MTDDLTRDGNREPNRTRRRRRRSLRKALLVAVALVVLTTGGYLTYVAIRHDRLRALSPLTGPYAVGRIEQEWVDHHRSDPLAPTSGRPRKLAVWVWYPADASSTRAPAATYAPGLWGQLHFPGLLGWGETSFNEIAVRARSGPPVADGRFPVVVFEPGLGFAAPQYTALAEQMASHGYLVVGVTPTYSANLTVLDGHAVPASAAGNPSSFNGDNLHIGAAARDGEALVQVWSTDARFAAHQADLAGTARTGSLAGHVDSTRTAYVGHSFGGAAALEACRQDTHCVAAADLDGTQFGPVTRLGLRRPLLLVASQHSCITGTCASTTSSDRADQDTARTLLAASTGPIWCYQIQGAEHFNFTDYALYYLAAPLHRMLALGEIDGQRGLTITAAYLNAFLDHTVGQRDEPLLRAPSPPYPEVRSQRTPR